MPIAGAVDTAAIDLDVFGSDTVARLSVVLDRVVVATPTAAPVDWGDPARVNQSWRARVPYALPGLYVHRWTITGTGEGTQTLRVPVEPADDAGDPRHTYATSTQLAVYIHAAPPLDADKKLRDASSLIDDVLMCAIYDTDSLGMPTDADVIDCLERATCEQVKWRIATGDDDDVSGLYSSVSIAGISLARSRSGKGQTAALTRLGPGVADILAAGGLLGQAPWGY